MQVHSGSILMGIAQDVPDHALEALREYAAPVVPDSLMKLSETNFHGRVTPKNQKKIWIDLDNSPHVPFFIPIIEELQKRGHQILLTARDSYQVCELLEFHHLACKVVGGHWGKNRFLKT